jgi:hypothetical protein
MGPPQDAIGNELVSAFPLAAICSRCFPLRVAERATEHAPYRTATSWTGVPPVSAFQFEDHANGRENGGTDEKRTYALKREPQGNCTWPDRTHLRSLACLENKHGRWYTCRGLTRAIYRGSGPAGEMPWFGARRLADLGAPARLASATPRSYGSLRLLVLSRGGPHNGF